MCLKGEEAVLRDEGVPSTPRRSPISWFLSQLDTYNFHTPSLQNLCLFWKLFQLLLPQVLLATVTHCSLPRVSGSRSEKQVCHSGCGKGFKTQRQEAIIKNLVEQHREERGQEGRTAGPPSHLHPSSEHCDISRTYTSGRAKTSIQPLPVDRIRMTAFFRLLGHVKCHLVLIRKCDIKLAHRCRFGYNKYNNFHFWWAFLCKHLLQKNEENIKVWLFVLTLWWISLFIPRNKEEGNKLFIDGQLKAILHRSCRTAQWRYFRLSLAEDR